MSKTPNKYLLLNSIKNKTYMNYLDSSNQAKLMKYCLTMHPKCMDQFYSIYSFNKNFNASYNNYSIIKELVYCSNHDILSDILSNQNIDFNRIDFFEINYTYDIDYRTIKLLIEHKSDINMGEGTLLMSMIKFNDYERFTLLVENGADFLSNTKLFECAIDEFCYSYTKNNIRKDGSRKILEYFIVNGANINNTSKNIFFKIIQYADIPIIQIMLEHGMNLDLLTVIDLAWLIKSRDIELVDFLVKNGVDFTKVNSITLNKSRKQNIDYFNRIVQIGVDPEILVGILSKCSSDSSAF